MVAKQKQYFPTKQIPWLAFGETEYKERKFYNLLEDRHYYLDVPELYGKAICGSSFGWLFTFDRKLKFHLVNPLTRECYDLPTPPLSEGDLGPYDQKDVQVQRYMEAESDDEEAHGIWRRTFEELQRILVAKGILDYDPSMRSDFTVVILYGTDDTLAFWRPGDNAWTSITDPQRFDDVTFFEGKVYAVRHSIPDNYSEIYTFKVGIDPQATKVKLRVPLHGDSNYVIEDKCVNSSNKYLIDFNGRLHLVERFLEQYDEHRLTTDFVVHKLDLEENSYSTCPHINGHAIFLGGCSPVIISASKFPNCMKDAIYFTDLEVGHTELYGAEDIGIYDMIGKNITPFYPRDVYHHTLAAPIWFTPNPW